MVLADAISRLLISTPIPRLWRKAAVIRGAMSSDLPEGEPLTLLLDASVKPTGNKPVETTKAGITTLSG